MNWRPISGEREAFVDPRGFTVIRPLVRPPPSPLFCPVCDLMMRTDEDVRRWREDGCCHQCAMKWCDPQRERWASGWRPPPEDVESEVSRRRAVPIGVKLEETG